MARKSKSSSRGMQRNTKIEPAVQSLYFATPSMNGSRTVTIDISRCASIANRRFYRQGLNWAVSSVELTSATDTTGNVVLAKLPQTWTMSNAWEKGFRHYMEMINQAMEGTESIRPRFLDFKIYMDTYHHGSALTPTNYNLLPNSINGAGRELATPGEWDYSKVSIPNTSNPGTANEYEILALGSNYPGQGDSGLEAVSLIEGYAASRGLPYPEDPNVPTDASDVSGTSQPQNWIGALTNEGTRQDEQVLDAMVDENNQAPYPFENGGIDPLTGLPFIDTMYPGGANQMTGLEMVDGAYITPSTIGGVTRLRGSNFPCGLLRLAFANVTMAGDQFIGIKVNLVPGPHRGYLCESMTEM
jgi:hypothetical protein